ncbi:MAG: phosphoenolpyruvate kinase [Myxococcales bacterium]|nr:phosphoenolpyruvate kinase [Polyangiaceae bacterium]MDW8249613.1 phosphoenolpyruvate kinase [Myxococcales bacterium]
MTLRPLLPLAEREALLNELGENPPLEPATGREPVHVVYGGGHLFRATTAGKLGKLAVQMVATYAPDESSFAEAMGLPEGAGLRERVLRKLELEPVEDYRIDFEDGYGLRSDGEEDEHASAAAKEVARGLREGSLPTWMGLRCKALSSDTQGRALRTLDRFFSSLHGEGEAPPEGFVVTLPKVSSTAQVAVLVGALERIERAAGWSVGRIRVELMIETPAALVSPEGRLAPRRLVEAARGRCSSVHFGTYDYTAACGITAEHQRPDHMACLLARGLLQVSLAGTGVRISDGATTVLPTVLHPVNNELTEGQREENRKAIHRAWRVHVRNVTRALEEGIYQGWDLHPGQLPARYAALYAFFLAGAPESGRRLRHFMARAAQATQVGGVFDDAATGQGLLNYFRRALSCGALTAEEVRIYSGLDPTALQVRSFGELAGREGVPFGG